MEAKFKASGHPFVSGAYAKVAEAGRVEWREAHLHYMWEAPRVLKQAWLDGRHFDYAGVPTCIAGEGHPIAVHASQTECLVPTTRETFLAKCESLLSSAAKILDLPPMPALPPISDT